MLSEEEFRRYDNGRWHDIASILGFDFEKFQKRWMIDRSKGMSACDFYNEVIVPEHTLLGQFLSGYEDDDMG